MGHDMGLFSFLTNNEPHPTFPDDILAGVNCPGEVKRALLRSAESAVSSGNSRPSEKFFVETLSKTGWDWPWYDASSAKYQYGYARHPAPVMPASVPEALPHFKVKELKAWLSENGFPVPTSNVRKAVEEFMSREVAWPRFSECAATRNADMLKAVADAQFTDKCHALLRCLQHAHYLRRDWTQALRRCYLAVVRCQVERQDADSPSSLPMSRSHDGQS
jgi:hypothetical protein